MVENVLYYGDNLDILRRYIKDVVVEVENIAFHISKRYGIIT